MYVLVGKRLACWLLAVLSTIGTLLARPPIRPPMGTSQARTSEKDWVEKTLGTMTLEEKIGQLFMVDVYTKQGAADRSRVEQLIRQYHVGGLLFMKTDAQSLLQTANYLQSVAKYPLLIAIDGETGPSMRVTDALRFPKQMTLGAISEEAPLRQVGQLIGRQCRRLGIHLNFAPVLDVNTNPQNPVIGARSYGEIKQVVASKGRSFMQGMQSERVLACAKHFPGHGDTDKDSHHTLPSVSHSRQRLNEVELYPFRTLAQDTIRTVMVGHLHVPALDNSLRLPASLSRAIAHDILRDSLGFKGLVVTDGMGMLGVAEQFSAGEAALRAAQAGNDIILQPVSVPKGVETIRKAITEGKWSEQELNDRVRHILTAKYFAGLDQYAPAKAQQLLAEVNSAVAEALKQELYEKAITLVRNQGNGQLPLLRVQGIRFALVNVGSGGKEFAHMLGKYAPFSVYTDPHASEQALASIFQKVKAADVVVVGIYPKGSKRYGVPAATEQFIKRLQQAGKQVITVLFGSPYGLKYLEASPVLLCAYEADPMAQHAAAEAIFGANDISGRLPVSATPQLPAGTGLRIKRVGRVGYSLPERVGMSSMALERIDSLARIAIREQATPGCQVVVIKDGKVIYDKAFGFLTYSKEVPVTPETLFDLASVTKVAASVQALMYLYDRKEFSLSARLSDYMPEARGTNKASLRMQDMLTHSAPLKQGYFFWRHFYPNGTCGAMLGKRSETRTIPVADSLYVDPQAKERMLQYLFRSELDIRSGNGNGQYSFLYSDVGYHFFQHIIERKSGHTLDAFMQQKFFAPMGLQYIGYNPLSRFPKKQIAPTEMDVRHRKQLVWGHVHDLGAALHGGVAGHAGLFSNAHDLAVLLQMNLQDGYYGGQQFFGKQTMDTFNSQPLARYGNRRGLGWDKPSASRLQGLVSPLASKRTFGHTGFTGTAVWADPDHNLVYVFLSNRVYPYAHNRKLANSKFRERIQTIIYQSMATGVTQL